MVRFYKIILNYNTEDSLKDYTYFVDPIKNISRLPKPDRNDTDNLRHYVMGSFMQLVDYLFKKFNSKIFFIFIIYPA